MPLKIDTISWFSNVGDIPGNNELSLNVKNVKDLNECLKHISSLKWEDFILYAGNRLSWYIQLHYKEESRKWNDVVKQAHSKYKEIEEVIIAHKNKMNIHDDILIDVKGICISYFIEKYYLELIGDEIPLHFTQLVEIYVDGHVPCGWDGLMPKNEGYEAINFETGKILIW